MCTRTVLLSSIASTIETYRVGEINTPNEEHIDRWAFQFTPQNQLAFLREFDHVIRQTFVTRDSINDFLNHLAAAEKITGNTPENYWRSANFLQIQRRGQSQRAMLNLFANCIRNQYGININDCGSPNGDFIYLDDIMFSGNRVENDLSAWIEGSAPRNATLHVIVIGFHTSGQYFTENKLKEKIRSSGKQITLKFWSSRTIENKKINKNISSVLWPAYIPTNQSVAEYVAAPSRYPFEPRQVIHRENLDPFSSEEGRAILESELFIAGARIWSNIRNPKPSLRPLGYSPFGIGFGSMISTYRNCPNNCPLALWWGDPEATTGAFHWYPLLPRITYDAPENMFRDLDDLTL